MPTQLRKAALFPLARLLDRHRPRDHADAPRCCCLPATLTPQELGVPVTQAPAYLMTLPYHPPLNLLVWPLFAWLYLRRRLTLPAKRCAWVPSGA